MARKTIASYGVRGNRRVNVVRDTTAGRVVVEWYVQRRPKRKSWPLTRDGERLAKAWAQAWYDSPAKAAAPVAVTLRDLWEQYHAAQADRIRPSTMLLYRERFDRFMLFAQPETPAESVTLHTIDKFWQSLLPRPEVGYRGIVPNQIRNTIGTVRVVLNWAESRELLTRNRMRGWAAPKGKKYAAMDIPEYAPEEVERLLATCRPQDGVRWRFAAAFLLASEHGFRSNAFLHLKWEDVDLARGTVTMVEEYDKTHKRIVRPLTWGALSALLTAKTWRERLGYDGPWVFFSGQRRRRDDPWSYQAANLALHRAEVVAKVPHVKYRAFHGVRRTVANSVRRMTGDPTLGLRWIGDSDLRQAKSYLKERDEEMQGISDQLGEAR